MVSSGSDRMEVITTVISSWPFLITAFILSWLSFVFSWMTLTVADRLSSVLDWSSWPPSFCDWLSLLAWGPSWLSFLFGWLSSLWWLPDSWNARDYLSHGSPFNSAQFNKSNNSIQSNYPAFDIGCHTLVSGHYHTMDSLYWIHYSGCQVSMLKIPDSIFLLPQLHHLHADTGFQTHCSEIL